MQRCEYRIDLNAHLKAVTWLDGHSYVNNTNPTLLTETVEDTECALERHDSDLNRSVHALYMIKIDGNKAYKKALDTVDSEVKRKLEAALKKSQTSIKTRLSIFSLFLYYVVIPHYRSQIIQYKNLEAIKDQLMGAAFSSENVLKLTKYETSLNRKFQSLLSTLIKLQGIRSDDT